MQFALVACLAIASVTARDANEGVTPLQKVIKLITNLKAEVLSEGQAEAKTYEEFACFCKDKTGTISKSITTAQDKIDELSADIEEDTTSKAKKGTELEEKKARKEQLNKDLASTDARCLKEQAAYEAANADLNKAIVSLNAAIKAIENSKPSSSSSASSSAFLAVRKVFKQSQALAEAMKMLDKAPAWDSNARAFLQEDTTVDPQDPDFKFHSQDIINILNDLLKDFAKQKTDADAEWAKTDKNCIDEKKDIGEDIELAGKAITGLDGDIDKLEKNIGTDRGSLVTTEAELKDNQLYLEDLTAMCQERAKDWDQRSAARGEELKALTQALNILLDDASDVESVNERALLVQQGKQGMSGSQEVRSSSAVVPSFLQQLRLRVATRGGAAAANAGAAADKDAQSVSAVAALATGQEARKAKAVAALQEASGRLGSTALASLAARVSADPFAKVKKLIQDLTERLIQEATDEAGKKGFCDKKLSTTKKDRDFRMSDVLALNAEIETLEAKEDKLKFEIKELGEAIKNLNKDLGEAQTLRQKEHQENLRTIAKANDGAKAVAKAIDVLTMFYKNAAKAFVQTSAQQKASPVDEDTTGAGFEGSYKGKQEASEGIVGILEVIQSDFERTIKITNKEESAAQAKFVEFDRASKSDVAGKSTTKERDEEELDATTRTKTTKMDDLKTNMGLVDSALKQLEELKPLCIDSGMSYDDRVAKREEEIAALKKALCQLDEDNVETECTSTL